MNAERLRADAERTASNALRSLESQSMCLPKNGFGSRFSFAPPLKYFSSQLLLKLLRQPQALWHCA